LEGDEFDGEAMNTIDTILSTIGQPTDGLGPNWSPLERVVHKFHMKDLWAMLRENYDLVDQVRQHCRVDPTQPVLFIPRVQ